MPREHARIAVSIWQDEDFQDCSPLAQWVYVRILAQPAINYAGVCELTVRKWARSSKRMDEGQIEKGLTELDEHGFLVVDRDTDEVLVRSFIRNDGVLKQPNMLIAACRQAQQVESVRLRTALGRELRRIVSSVANEKARGEVSGALRVLDPEGPPPPEEANDKPSVQPKTRSREGSTYERSVVGTRPSGEVHVEGMRQEMAQDVSQDKRQPHGVGKGLGKGEVTSTSTQVERSRALRACAREAPVAVARTQVASTTAIIDAYAARCRFKPPREVTRGLTPQVGELVRLEWPVELIERCLDVWASKRLHHNTFASVAHEVANSVPAVRPGIDEKYEGWQQVKREVAQRQGASQEQHAEIIEFPGAS